MGFNNPTPIQEQVIPHILKGADVIACAQTGTGKTAAYLLPVLDKISRDNIPHTCALIISPTRELALQIDQAFQGFSYFTHASSIAVYGGSDGITFEREKKSSNRWGFCCYCYSRSVVKSFEYGVCKIQSTRFFNSRRSRQNARHGIL